MVPWLGLLANGLLIAGGWWLAGHAFRLTRVVDRVLATGVLAFTWCVLGLELLGPAALLRIVPITAWACSLAALGMAARFARPRRCAPPEEHAHEAARLSWYACLALGLVLWACASLGMQSLLLPVKVVSDAPIYHLYFAARWWKAGRLFLVPIPFGENAATYFPANGDLWFTWLMTTWGGDRLARTGQVPFLFLAALAVWGICRRLGASRNAAMVATCWFVSTTPLLIFSFEANVDSVFVASYMTAVYFALVAQGESSGTATSTQEEVSIAWDTHTRTLILCGLAAGLALGTKTVGLVFIPPVLILILLMLFAREGSFRWAIRPGLIVLASVLVPSAFWYGRNLILTGNLLYPLHVKLLGTTVLAGWYDRQAMQFSPYYLPPGAWRALLDTLLAVLDPRLVPLWLAALAGGWAIGNRGSGRSGRWVWVMAFLAILNVVLWWTFIPYRTQQRFFLHAVGLAAVPLARLLDRGRWLTLAAMALLALHVLTPQPWPLAVHDQAVPWDFSRLIPNVVPAPLGLVRLADHSGERRIELAPAPRLYLTLGAGACALVAAFAVTRLATNPTGRWRTGGLAMLASAGMIVLAALETGAVGTDARLLIYPGFPDYYRGWQFLESVSGPAGTRIAYAGTNIPYYLMGAGLRNDVRYVNLDGHRDWLLHDYHREAVERGEPTWPNPRPGWDRAHPDDEAWLANLRAEGIRLLVVARVNPGEGPHNVADAEGFPIEKVWAEHHPEQFEPLHGVTPRDPFFRIYRLRPSP